MLIDILLGEPPEIIHPVVICGKISERTRKPYGSRLHGILTWTSSVVPLLLLLSILPFYIPNLYLKIIILAIILKTTFSVRLLYSLVSKASNLDESSRYYVQQIVRRNVYELDLPHVASAAIESLFESTVDGITSPIFWYIMLGLPGALLQRFANTLDSMVGYKTMEWKDEGWFSAKIDTILNYIPARLTGIFMLLAALLLKFDIKNGIESLRSAKMESPNARYPIAIAAGVLRVRLEKIGSYSVGYGDLPQKYHIKAALKLFILTIILYLLSLSLLEVLVLHDLSLIFYLLRKI